MKLQWQLPDKDIQKEVLVRGTVISHPKQKFRGVQFLFELKKIGDKEVSGKILLSWYQHPPYLSVGQRLQLWVKLKPPLGLHNPGGFDYGLWLKHHDINATGYVVSRKSYQLLTKRSKFLLADLRAQVQQVAMSANLENHTVGAVLSALAVGMRQHLSSANWQVFQKTGTSHLIAISGLHIGLIAGVLLSLVQYLWKFSERLLLWLPAKRAGLIGSIFGAFFYTALSGFAVPAQRAFIMILFMMLGDLVGHELSFLKRMFCAFIVIIFWQPFAIYSGSLWLSFFAVGILGYLLCARLTTQKGVLQWARLQVLLFIALIPLSLWFFQQTSMIAIIANAIAIPWVSMLIVPSVLVGVLILVSGQLKLAMIVFHVSGMLLQPLWQFLKILSSFDWSYWHHSLPAFWLLLTLLLGVFMLLSPRGMQGKMLGCFGFLPLFFYHPKTPDNQSFWMTVIDVGQGLSILIQTANHNLLYDTGIHIPNGFDAGKSVVFPYLSQAGVSELDKMIISHGDNDHSGGAAAIYSMMPVHSVMTSAPRFKRLFHGVYCHVGQSWVWDGVHFEILSPLSNKPYMDNNSSCVMKVSNGAGSVLLTGDLEKAGEREVINAQARNVTATVLVAGHHGSRTSSSVAFLKAVSPRVGIISLGAYNRYHFPSKLVLSRFKKQKIKVYRTDKNGAISVRFLATGQVIYSSYRNTGRKLFASNERKKDVSVTK